MTGSVRFFERPYPSANAVLLLGERPVLVDPGFGADLPALEAWLREQGMPPARLALVVNTHFDCDHAGANHGLAARYGVPVAAHAIEAALVNARDPAACRARLLRQPVEPYRVARSLVAGDVVETGAASWQVVHTPGHTTGHLSLLDPVAGALVSGDALYADDLGWVDPNAAGALEASAATIERLAGLTWQVGYCGHGPAILDREAALTAAQRRLAGWRGAPERMAWHGAKRVFAYALMIEGGMLEADVVRYLLGCPWVLDYAAAPFGVTADMFAGMLVAEMLRSKAAHWEGGRLLPSSPFVAPPAGWRTAPGEPALWPR